jgi:hypothetical protein
LIEEAMASTDPALMAHLAGCADCRAELAGQRELQERITSGIAALVAGEPSPALLMRVRARLAEESAPRTFPWMQWAAAGVAVTALAAAALWFAARPSAHMPAPEVKSAQALKNPSSPAQTPSSLVALQQPAPSAAAANHKQVVAGHVTHPKPFVPTSRVTEIVRPSIAVAANSPRGEIIVPAGQREAVLRLVDALRTGRVDAASLLRTGQQGDLAPLAIAPIEVKPVQGSDQDDRQGHQLDYEF